MLQTLITRIGWFFLLLFLQSILFNHIHLMGYATPMPYVYFLLLLPSNTPHWLYVLLGFLLGLLVDIFSNTPGMAAASLCFTGLLTPLMLQLSILNNRNEETFIPSARTLEWSGFLCFAGMAVVVNTFVFFCIEHFNFFNTTVLLVSGISSALLTFLFVIALELFRISGSKK